MIRSSNHCSSAVKRDWRSFLNQFWTVSPLLSVVSFSKDLIFKSVVLVSSFVPFHVVLREQFSVLYSWGSRIERVMIFAIWVAERLEFVMCSEEILFWLWVQKVLCWIEEVVTILPPICDSFSMLACIFDLRSLLPSQDGSRLFSLVLLLYRRLWRRRKRKEPRRKRSCGRGISTS